jgi:type II secretory pathway pseudopilin PulG
MPAPTPARPGGDAGFGLLETLISLMLVSIIMTAVTSFFVVGTNAQRRQRETVTATRLAADAMDRVQGIKGVALSFGRDYATSHAAWTSQPAAVSAYLANTVEKYDNTAATGAGATATLPTTAGTITADGITYTQRWYLGQCWVPASGGSCTSTSSATAVPLYRVVVLITWPDRSCGTAGCSFVTATLVSSAGSDPLFQVV